MSVCGPVAGEHFIDQVPLFPVVARALSEDTNAQYAGFLAGLAPADPIKLSQALSLSLSVEDLSALFIRFFFEQDPEVKVCGLSAQFSSLCVGLCHG